MQIYLPIAEIAVNVFLLLGLGALTGVLSGMFGVGGGFLMTPFLMFIGVPPAVAVATSANHIVASSVSGFLSYWKRAQVDFKMGGMLLAGGWLGSTLGVFLFQWLRHLGQIDVIISVFYVFFLGAVGALMMRETIKDMLNVKPVSKPPGKFRAFIAHLPWLMHFPRSKLHISALMPLALGLLVGVLVSLMGVGGGFFLIPAMIYVLGMPTSVVIGTSLFQIIFISANVTFLQALTTQTVDIMLAFFLICGSVVGAQLGSKIGEKLPADKLRGLLAFLVLIVTIRLAYGLFATPATPWLISGE